jgi:hypothetical protein
MDVTPVSEPLLPELTPLSRSVGAVLTFHAPTVSAAEFMPCRILPAVALTFDR